MKDLSQATCVEDFLPTEDERREAQINAIQLGIHLVKCGAGRIELPVGANGKQIKVTVEYVDAALTQPVNTGPSAELHLRDLLERTYSILENVAIADSGDPEQDAFEREVFEDVKKELGK